VEGGVPQLVRGHVGTEVAVGVALARSAPHPPNVRAGRWADSLSDSRHHERMSQRPRPAVDGVEPPATGSTGVSEQGAFAFATCPVCGWRGPGRRSRERARQDLTDHLTENRHVPRAEADPEELASTN
jgi:hypothetical protein